MLLSVLPTLLFRENLLLSNKLKVADMRILTAKTLQLSFVSLALMKALRIFIGLIAAFF